MYTQKLKVRIGYHKVQTNNICPFQNQFKRLHDIPMSKWTNEVKAAMGSIVRNITSIEATLVGQKLLKLIIDVFNNRLVAIS